MPDLHPAAAPYATGMLDVGDGHSLYWQAFGNPHGKPAVALHGGPGGGSIRGLPRRFDPAVYRLVQFDQRGCGRSTPHAGAWATDLATNTTHHLIADIERLRAHLGIERWLVWGASWGVTLGLAYDRLLNAHPAVRLGAAREWVAWEDALLSLEPGYPCPNPGWADEPYTIAFARLVSHYFAHAAWLDEGELLANTSRLAQIPAVLIHGQRDVAWPVEVARELARAWPGAELHVVEGGHTGDAEMERLQREAIARFGARG